MDSSYNYINPEDFKRILDAIPELGLRKWATKDIQMLFKIMYWCCLRFDEGINLEFEKINIEEQRIFLGKTKTQKSGKAVIPDRFTDDLTDWLSEKSKGRLFDGLTYNTAIRWIYKLGEMLQIEAWTTRQSVTGEKTMTHIFRKSVAKDILYGTHTSGKKGPMNVIAKVLRHTDMMNTTHYLKVPEKDVEDYWDQK